MSPELLLNNLVSCPRNSCPGTRPELGTQEQIERIHEKTTPAENKKLDVLQTAYDELLDAYSKDRSAANLKNWQAAEAALGQAIKDLEAKYFAEDPAFPNIMAVVGFLQEEGYKIKKSTVYQHRDKGLINVEPNGTIPRPPTTSAPWAAKPKRPRCWFFADLDRVMNQLCALDDLKIELNLPPQPVTRTERR